MISQYAKHLPFHYTNHLALQADEVDTSGIGLHWEADSVKNIAHGFQKDCP